MKTSRVVEVTLLLAVGGLLVGVLLGVYFVTAGVSARPQPGGLERLVARGEQMEALNPKSPEEVRQQIQESSFFRAPAKRDRSR